MLQELRDSISPPLSRQQLATLINRSPNYVLKAESLTFPHVPPALLDFYTTQLDYPRPLLIQQYRAAQRSRRRRWLHKWEPQPQQPQPSTRAVGALQVNDWPKEISFCNSWVLQSDITINPTQYAVSQGLCVPAAAIYTVESQGAKIPKALKTALEDLESYCESGEALAETHLDEEAINRTLLLIRHFKGM